MDALRYFQSTDKTGKKIVGIEPVSGSSTVFKIKYEGGGIGMRSLPGVADEAQAAVVNDMRGSLIPYEEDPGSIVRPMEREMMLRSIMPSRPDDYPDAEEELPWK